jgi:hypothetical protein
MLAMPGRTAVPRARRHHTAHHASLPRHATMKLSLVARAALMITVAAATIAIAPAAHGQPTVSGRANTARIANDCLCGTSAVGSLGRCFRDVACGDAQDCIVDSDCDAGFFCIAGSNCCLVPKCVESCSPGSCTVAPGHGVCQSYDLCAPGGGCGFNGPGSAKQAQLAVVQAFVSCGNPGGNPPNAMTETGVPSCSPPQTFREQAGAPATGWSWDERTAAGNVRLKVGANNVRHLNVDAAETGDLSVQLKLSGIVDGAGPAEGTGTLSTVFRVTLRDRQGTSPGPGDDEPMTVIDYPAVFSFDLIAGAAKLKTTLNTLRSGSGELPLPKCTSLELVDVGLLDTNGDRFGSVGVLLK